MAGIFIKPRHLLILEGIISQASRHKAFLTYLDRLNKKPGAKLTIYEYAEINDISPEIVRNEILKYEYHK